MILKYAYLLLLLITIVSACKPTPVSDSEQSNDLVVVIETNRGYIEIELLKEDAPITVANFLKYVESDHYKGTVFHRVIPGFMIQGGGFTKKGAQKPTGPPIIVETNAGIANTKGTVAMARTSDPNSATSQFFINTADNNFLNPSAGNPGYAVFARVISGNDAIRTIELSKTGTRLGLSDWPSEDVIITNVYVKDGKSVRVTEPFETTRISFKTLELKDGGTLEYGIALPQEHEEESRHPVLLVFPPGLQDREMVNSMFNEQEWLNELINNGWIVISPVASNGVLFFRGGEVLIPELISDIKNYNPENSKIHVGGISNGGISAFRVASQNADDVKSLVVLPGFSEEDQLVNLKDIPVRMFVGGRDYEWRENVDRTEEILKVIGADVDSDVIWNEDHVITSLAKGTEISELFESFRN